MRTPTQTSTTGTEAARIRAPIPGERRIPARGRAPRTLSPRPARGFTLVELLFVMVIAALALGLVGASISQSISGAEMRTAARKVTAAMRYTRTKAILSKAEQVFHIDTETLEYTAADREPVELPEGMQVELNTARSELTSETAGGIRFFPDGGSTGGNVRLEANGRIYRVNVNWLTGEAVLQQVEE